MLVVRILGALVQCNPLVGGFDIGGVPRTGVYIYTPYGV